MTARTTDADSRARTAKDAVTREAKGSVHEAIGTLIGDDAARARGTAERQAGAADAASTGDTPPPR